MPQNPYFDEINMKIPKKKKPLYLRLYLSDGERRSLIAELGDGACLLFEYYIRLASIGNQAITDEDAAEYFGWNVHKAKRLRHGLTKAGWFLQVKYNLNQGRKGVTYYFGKEAVRDASGVASGRLPATPAPALDSPSKRLKELEL